MSSGDGGTRTDRPASPSAGPVPVGWQRKVEEGSVCYISPSGAALTSLEQTCAYLLADGTCKCGLECPLDMHKVFNFDPGAAVAGRGAPGAQGQQDMTKLCNHRRKTAAMATLYHSMEGPPGLCRPGTGPGLTPLLSAEGHPPTVPSTGTPLPGALGSFPRVPLGTKTPEATSTPTGTWLVASPFLQPHGIVPGAAGTPDACSPTSPCFGLPLPPPDAATPPRSPVAQSQCPPGRTSNWAGPSPGATGEGPGPSLSATAGAPQVGEVDSPVSDALTSPSSNNPPVPLDAVPEGGGFLGLPPTSPPFSASSLLSSAAEAQLGSPHLTPAPSTLPPCPLPPATLLSLLAECAPGRGARWRPDPPEPAAPRVPPEPKGTPPAVIGQPLVALLSLLGAQGYPGEGGPGGSNLPLGPLPATNGSPCPGTGLLPPGRDVSGQLLGLFGQLAASSEPTSGTSPRSKASGPTGGPALGQHPPACGGDPEGPSLPSLLAASLLPLPLGVSLPALDLLPSPGTLLSALLPLSPAPRQRSPEGCPALPDRAPFFSALPASLALHPALLAAGLGPPEPAPAAPPSSLASPSVAPTSSGALPATTEPPGEEGRAPASPTGALEPLNLLAPALLSATLLGNVPALSPLLQNQPLLPPLGLSLSPGSPLGTAGPLASLLQSLQGGKGLPPAAPPAPHPAWRCNGNILAAEQQLRVEEIKGNSLHLRPSCRGWRRKASTPRPSTRLETPQRRGLSTSPGAGPAADLAVARWPGRPVKNRRRKLLT